MQNILKYLQKAAIIGVFITQPILSYANLSNSSSSTINAASPNMLLVPITITGSTSFCEGDARTLTLSTANAAAKIQWFRNGLPIAGARARVYIATDGGTYSAIDTFNSVITNWDNLTLVKLTKPTAAISPASNQTLCTGGSVQLNATAIAGATYLWSNGATTPSILVNTPGTYSYIVTNGLGCKDTSDVICVTQAATASATASATVVCEGSIVNFTSTTNNPFCGNSKNITWTVTYNAGSCSSQSINFVNGTSPSSANPQIRFNNPGLYTITVTNTFTGSNGTCATASFDRTLTVTSKSSGNITIPTEGCAGTPINISATPSVCFGGGTPTYVWNFPGATPSTASTLNPGNIVYSTPGTYTITYTEITSCGVTNKTETITIGQTPVLNPISNFSICSGSPVNIALSSNTSASTTSYTWTAIPEIGIIGSNSGSGTSINDVLTNEATSSKTVSYFITPINNVNGVNCVGTTYRVIVTVLPEIVLNDMTDKLLCSGSNFNQAFSLETAYPGTTYTYTASIPSGILGASSGTGNSVTQTLTNTTGTPLTVVYSVMATTLVSSTSCNSSVKQFSVTVNPITRVLNGTETVCESSGSSINISTNTPSGNTTYTWNAINAPVGFSGIVASGTGNSIPMSIDVNDTVIYAKKISYRVVTTSTFNGLLCNGITDTIDVFINPEPKTNAIARTRICSGDSVIIIPTSNTSAINTVYNWSAVFPSSITGISPGQGKSIRQRLVNSSAEPQTVIYSITPITQINGVNCPGQTIFDTVEVNPKPVILNTLSTTICSGEPTDLTFISNTGNFSSASTTYSWTVQPAPGIFGGSNSTGLILNDVLNNTSNQHQSVRYKVVALATFNGVTCYSDTTIFTFIVNPKPIVNPISTNIICSGSSAGVNFSANTISSNTSYLWTVTPPVGITGAANGSSGGLTPGITNVLTNTTTSPIPVVYTITPFYQYNNLDCFGSSIIDTVYVLPTPNATISGSKTICSGDNVNESISFDTNPSFSNINWSVSAVAGVTGATSGTGTLINNTLNTTNVFPSLVTYYITPQYTFRGLTCDGPTKTFIVTVNPIPNYNKDIPRTVCSGPFVKALSSNTANNQTMYNWTATSKRGSGGVSNGSGVQISTTFNNSTTILDTVIYTITPIFGNNSVNCNGLPEIDTIYVNPNPRSSVLRDTICSGGITSVTLATGLSPAISSYSWVVSNANGVTGTSAGTSTSIQQTLINTTGEPRLVTYLVTPKAQFGSLLCDGSQYNVEVLVYPATQATILNTTTVGCAPFNLASSITGASPFPSSINEYRWYADNTLIGTGTTFPGYIMTNADDTVQIKLVVTSLWGCVSDSQTVQFITTRIAEPSFTSSVTNGCGPLTVTFNNTSPVFAGQTLQWNFGNGQTTSAYSPTPIVFAPHPLGRDTTYVVTLTGTTACSTVTYTNNITVKSKAKALFSPDKISGCSPLTVNFSNVSRGSGSTYTWDFGNGNTFVSTNINDPISQTYNSTVTDTIYVKLISQNSCGIDSIGYNIIVFPPTVNANIVVDALELNGCAPHTVQIINSSLGSTLHTYDFGDLSALYQSNKAIDTIYHTYSQAGDYTINFTAANGCASANDQITVKVFSSPIAQFTTLSNVYCQGETVPFQNSSLGASTYLWDFGDGYTSIQNSPSHRYDTSGTFTVRLISYQFATTGLTCSDTFNAIITIDKILKPELTATLDSVYCGINTITATALAKGQFITSWKTGDFINNADFIQFGPNFSHTYTTSGVYFITLFYETVNGCMDSTKYKIIINEKPNSIFTASKIYLCENGTVTFTNNSTYNGLFPLKFDYIINGNTIVDSTNLTYFFNPTFTTDSFVYNVALVAYDAIGCTDTSFIDIIVKNSSESIIALQSPSLGCAPYIPNIANNSKHADFYEWYVNDVLVSSLATPSIVLPTANTSYKIKLATSNKANCDPDSSFLTIGTHPEVVSNVKASDTVGCFGQLFVNFSNTSVGTSVNIWDFGDGSPLNNASTPSHLFVNPGVYTVTHIAESSAGCRDTSTLSVKVGKNIQAKYVPSATFGCGILSVDFVNESQNAVSVKWDFDDGTFSVDPSPQHTFPSREEPYKVKLFAYNEIGCVDTFIFPVLIKVGIPPVVNFDVDDTLKIIPERTFSFNTLATFPVTFRKWEFGDGIISYEKNPVHEYQFTGKYFVTLTEIDTGGCEESTTREVELKDLEGNLWVPNAFTPKSGIDKMREFLPVGYGIEKYLFQVFTSSGLLLFESTVLDQTGRPTAGWDGTYKGKEMPQGSYIWSIEAKFLNGTTWKGMPDENGDYKRVGTVLIIK